jgi:hypothetical protein
MNPEMNPMDPELERAVSEIRDEPVDSAAIEAAAARVWARLAEAAGEQPSEHIRGCADFQALIPEYRAGRLPEARALLLKDHLNNCVACRRVYEGRVVAFPSPHAAPAPRVNRYVMRWAAAAAVVAAAGVTVWLASGRFGQGSGRAVIQAVNGALYEISDTGVRALAAGQDLPDGVEIRTAKDSYATLRLQDGSIVQMRERASLSTSRGGADLTLRLGRGNIIVEAAKRRSGHLYVATADCRVAVTGTVFSVNAGTKGSRVSVIQGEVHVAENNREDVLHPGQQSVSGSNLEEAPIQYDISWSREADRFNVKPANSGTVSRLLQRVPAGAAFVAFIPDPAASLSDAQDSIRRMTGQNPQLRAAFAGQDPGVERALGRLKEAGSYLTEMAIVGLPDGHKPQLVFLAGLKRAGLADFLKKADLPVTVEERSGMAAFTFERGEEGLLAQALNTPANAFSGSPCYSRIADAQRQGAGAVVCADASRLGAGAGQQSPLRYVMGEERRVRGAAETRATFGFAGQRTGIASWLAAPAPMGSLDYISPDATFVAAFVVKSPAVIVDEMVALQQRSREAAEKGLAEARRQTGIDVRNDLAAALGGEFAIAVDGPLFPTPAVKLIAEVYDPVRFQATIQKLVDAYNREAVKKGNKPLRTARENIGGRPYYMIAGGNPNPLTEVHYTFADGYLVAGLSNALLTQAIQTRAARTSIARSSRFVAMMPRDHYTNFSAVVYENMGKTLSPLVGMFGALAPSSGPSQSKALQGLADMKPAFIAAYGEPDRITVAGTGSMFGRSLSNLTGGSLLGLAGGGLPLGRFQGTRGR